jgi:hypothetical protein
VQESEGNWQTFSIKLYSLCYILEQTFAIRKVNVTWNSWQYVNDFQQKEFLSHQTRPIYQPSPGLQMIVSTPPHDFTCRPPCSRQTGNCVSKMCHHQLSANSENSVPLSVSDYCCLGRAAVYSGAHILMFLRILKPQAAYCSNMLSAEFTLHSPAPDPIRTIRLPIISSSMSAS